MSNTLLIIVDCQNGFLNQNTSHILPGVLQTIEIGRARNCYTIFTRFVNHPDSGYVRWIKWSRFMAPPEIELVPEILAVADHVEDKSGYTSLTPSVRSFIEHKGVTRVGLCGIATDGCVLKTAVDVFEAGLEPAVFMDACASHAGPNIHEAGLTLLSRFIGKGQLVPSEGTASWFGK